MKFLEWQASLELSVGKPTWQSQQFLRLVKPICRFALVSPKAHP